MDIGFLDDDIPNWAEMGVDPPADYEPQVVFCWVGVSPVTDIRYIVPDESGCKVFFRDGDVAMVQHPSDHIAMAAMGRGMDFTDSELNKDT